MGLGLFDKAIMSGVKSPTGNLNKNVNRDGNALVRRIVLHRKHNVGLTFDVLTVQSFEQLRIR